MNRFRLSILSTLLAASNLVAQSFNEKTVEVSSEVEGKLLIPVKDKVQDAVLIMHGFNDHMGGVGNLQKQLERSIGPTPY